MGPWCVGSVCGFANQSGQYCIWPATASTWETFIHSGIHVMEFTIIDGRGPATRRILWIPMRHLISSYFILVPSTHYPTDPKPMAQSRVASRGHGTEFYIIMNPVAPKLIVDRSHCHIGSCLEASRFFPVQGVLNRNIIHDEQSIKFLATRLFSGGPHGTEGYVF